VAEAVRIEWWRRRGADTLIELNRRRGAVLWSWRDLQVVSSMRIATAGVARLVGAVAQLGERLVRNEEVSGSIPLSSTKMPNMNFA
jgi:hypothetical protein